MICLSEIVAGQRHCRTVSAPVFTKELDVIVCGVGTAGSLAALFSAENGLSVLGIEAFSCVGGTHSAGGIAYHYFGNPGGRYEKLEQQVHDFARNYTHTIAESRKFVLEQALIRQHVDILYEAYVCGVYMEENRVIGVRVLTNDGIADYGAKIVMDCTAEAQIAVMAGCETECGRDSDGQMQPYSLVSMVFDEKYKYTNVDFGRVDQNNDAALSRAILFARSFVGENGCHGKDVISQIPLLGIREGRRIIPEESVHLEDLFAGKQTESPMFYAYADLDKHGWDIAFDGETIGDWAIGANLGAYNVTVAVPYQAILPKDREGILVPCRALGVDRDISSCVRMNPDMKKLAECAAQWATLAIEQNLTLRQVPYSQLAQRLKSSGCLKPEDDRGYWVDGKRNWDGTALTPRKVHWITDPNLLAEQLKTEKPGEAIWSAKQMGEAAVPALRQLLASADENTKKHAAFALASTGHSDGIAILREMVTGRDGLMLKDSRKNNNLRGCMAIYWLGRLADSEILPELLRLICDPAEKEKSVYQQHHLKTLRYEIADFHNIYFQFLSQAVMASIRIGNAHPVHRAEIEKAFCQAFSDGTYYERITARPKESSEGNMVLALRNIAFSAAKEWFS